MKQKTFTMFTISFLFLGVLLGFTLPGKPGDNDPVNRIKKDELTRSMRENPNVQNQPDNNGSGNQTFGIPYYTDNFDGANDTTSLKNRGYKVYFRGTDIQGTSATWFQGISTRFNSFNGPPNGYVAGDYNVLDNLGTIDNWLVLPPSTISTGDSIVFQERRYPTVYLDSIRVMYSAAGDSVPEAGSWVELGRFEATTGSWGRKAFGAPSAGANGRYAIRYAVVDGGPAGGNSFYIGIDALTLESSTGFPNDMKATAFISPASGGTVGIGSTFTPQASFTNNGTLPQSNVPVRYRILNSSNTEIYNQTTTIPFINAGQTLTTSFPSTSIGSGGAYSLKARSELAGDQLPSNDSISGILGVGTPLAGDYTVGVALFNSITGKNITFEKVVTKVKKEMPMTVEKDNIGGKTAGVMESMSINNGPTVMQEVEQVSFVPMQNGVRYEGPLYADRNNYPNLPLDAGTGVYATITEAVSSLNLLGSSSAVRFLLLDANYLSETFPITINYSTASSVNTLTIQPGAGVTTNITGSFAGAIFKILSRYVTMQGSNTGGTSRDMRIENTNTSAAYVVHIGSTGATPITNVSIKNCNIINSVNASAIVIGDGTTLGNAGYFNNVTIQNNSVQRAYIGIYSIAVVASGNGNGLNIISNSLNSSGANAITFIGIYIQGVDGANISQNDIANFQQTESQDDKGMWLATGTKNSTIDRNRIHDLGYSGTSGYGSHGIYISTGITACNVVAKNNMIYGLSGDGWNYLSASFFLDNPIGIVMVTPQTGVKIYYNSIYLNGNTLNQTDAMSMGIILGTGTTADIRDNIIVNNLGLLGALGYGSTGVYAQAANTQFEQLNYDDYFVNPTGSGVKNLGQIAASGATTLVAWQSLSGGEANGLNVDPLFVSSTDLHLSTAASSVNNAGVPIAGITIDFDGNTRNAATPDIGADEYVSGLQTLTLKISFQAYPGLDTIRVLLRNTTSPYAIVDSVTGLGGASIAQAISFTNAVNGVPYYIVVKYRNGIETWSSGTPSFAGNASSYDFTTSLSQAYQNNQVLPSVGPQTGIPSIFQADVNQSGNVNLDDILLVKNDATNFVTGPYLNTDFNGSGNINLDDILIVSNNNTSFVAVKRP